MQGRIGLVPLASVKIEAIFRDICKIDDAEDGRMVRPGIRVVWRRLAQIVESCPHELSDAPRVVLVCSEIVVRNIGPPAVFCVV